ncbi:MAG: DUF1232 domain-containing protein [Calditrichaceae bacterium]|jgi:hypothetical protein
MKNIFVILMGIISLLYILNPTAGIFELIPDNLPFVGNLDEAGAAALLMMCLRYFGLDLTRIFQKGSIKSDNKDNSTKDAN